MNKTKCAIIGSGNIGTDLMLKIIHTSDYLTLNGVIGIDPDSEGLAMASRRRSQRAVSVEVEQNPCATRPSHAALDRNVGGFPDAPEHEGLDQRARLALQHAAAGPCTAPDLDGHVFGDAKAVLTRVVVPGVLRAIPSCSW